MLGWGDFLAVQECGLFHETSAVYKLSVIGSGGDNVLNRTLLLMTLPAATRTSAVRQISSRLTHIWVLPTG